MLRAETHGSRRHPVQQNGPPPLPPAHVHARPGREDPMHLYAAPVASCRDFPWRHRAACGKASKKILPPMHADGPESGMLVHGKPGRLGMMSRAAVVAAVPSACICGKIVLLALPRAALRREDPRSRRLGQNPMHQCRSQECHRRPRHCFAWKRRQSTRQGPPNRPRICWLEEPHAPERTRVADDGPRRSRNLAAVPGFSGPIRLGRVSRDGS